ncbi:hypothetical protein HOP52_17105 [Halomonas campisalis]|uniref:Lipoprotein n=1 Tax=Billgrantia campisalis TaxID=74661 RepID=A0ABS9PDF1_9GAMM|nr:hypothetical protein [Halomonas campisalis]MCG6659474.1 hypothetical protein [Halomonas campisalis]MDR5864321.1 hypothetical protein [Halomonas campisalis]
MRRAFLAACAAISLLLSGCASQLSIQAQPAADHQTVYVAGQPLMLSDKQYSVAVSPSSSLAMSNESLSFLVFLTNTHDEPINFGPGNITALLNGQPIRVFTHEEVLVQMERDRDAQALSAALAGLGQSMSATGHQQHFGTMSGQYYGRQGYVGHGTGTYSGTTYDPTAAAVAQSSIQAKTQQNISNISQRHDQEIANARAALLLTETVYPGQSHGGYIRTEQLGDNNTSGTLNLTVTVDGEHHSFDFAVRNN